MFWCHTIFLLHVVVLVAATLCRVVSMFHRAVGVGRQQGLAVAATSFQTCRGRSILQCAGVTISLATTSILTVVAGLSLMRLGGPSNTLPSWNAAQCVNTLVNAAGIILLSGASTLITRKGILRFPPLGCRCRCRFRKCCVRSVQSARRSKNLETAEEDDWEKKTRELANRGISLEELLAFYKGLGDTIMPSFQPSVHTTNDVVRLAIIPFTFSSCSSYAELVNRGEEVLPKKMVTHNWSNLFRDLLASVIADAVGEHTSEFIAELLSDKAGLEVVEDMLRVHGSIQETFWICAFAVNQHVGICGGNPAATFDPVSGITHPICKCSKPKFFNKDPPLNAVGKSIHYEMNKFDDMMALLARQNPDFAEVVAVDASLDLFGRAWCVAELAEAHRMGMAQRLKMRNKDTLLTRQLTLQGLKVENHESFSPWRCGGNLSQDTGQGCLQHQTSGIDLRQQWPFNSMEECWCLAANGGGVSCPEVVETLWSGGRWPANLATLAGLESALPTFLDFWISQFIYCAHLPLGTGRMPCSWLCIRDGLTSRRWLPPFSQPKSCVVKMF